MRENEVHRSLEFSTTFSSYLLNSIGDILVKLLYQFLGIRDCGSWLLFFPSLVLKVQIIPWARPRKILVLLLEGLILRRDEKSSTWDLKYQEKKTTLQKKSISARTALELWKIILKGKLKTSIKPGRWLWWQLFYYVFY